MLAHDPGGKVKSRLATDVHGSAVFGGPRNEYRYSLARVWNSQLPATMFVMMNPSTADDQADDPTISRCQGFARSWGSGRLYVVNTFAYRSTDSRQLLNVPDPVGPDNDQHIIATARRSHVIVVAYGKPHLKLRQRAIEVCGMLRLHGFRLHTLKLNADGSPAHPLYLSGKLRPIKF